jgi:cytochrome c biogenesis protein CcmG, thiol:disulfide interchange protein DsbE
MDPRRHGAVALLALTSAVALAGCGGFSGGKPPDYARALRGAPAPLAGLYSQANQLIPGGKGALEKRLQRLRGYPVVVNLWASWCGECRFEFPFLQKLSARFGARVAFAGVDSEDSDGAAATWLEEAPVSYPSYTDPHHEMADSLRVVGLPDTAFYDRQGRLVFLKQGAYRDDSELEDQIKKLLQERS